MKPTISLEVLKILVRFPTPGITLDDLLSFTRSPADRLALFRYALHSPDSPINSRVSEPGLADLPEHALARG